MESRVIKKNDAYYPQYLNTWWFGKYKKWEYFSYPSGYSICAGFVQPINEIERFKTKHEARYFLRKKGYKL